MVNLTQMEQKNKLLWLQEWDANTSTWLADSFLCQKLITLTAEQAEYLHPEGQLVLGCLNEAGDTPILIQMYPVAGICGPSDKALLTFHHQLCAPQQYPLLCDLWGFLGGLLHDAGKLYLYYNQPAGEGVCEQHEALTFMCLQPQLNQLRQHAPRLFEALCGCLTQSDHHAASYLPETIVRMADRLSAEVCNWRRAFANTPSFYWYCKSIDNQRIYKRLGSGLVDQIQSRMVAPPPAGRA